MAALSKDQVAALLRKAGFPEEKIPLMVNIAGRESGLNPYAHNPNRATGDNSYGLFQINMIDRLGEARLKEFADLGVTSFEDLKDPWKNVQAAKRVYDSQGINAWTTAKAAMGDPTPKLTPGLSAATPGLSGVSSEADPLDSMMSAILGNTLSGASRRGIEPGRLASGPGFWSEWNKLEPGVAAQVAAVQALLPGGGRSAQVASTSTPLPASDPGLGAVPGEGLFVAKTGNSGISTGPHLDARWSDGRPIKPGDLDEYLRIGGKLPSELTLTSGYGPRNAPTAGASSFHKGIDLATESGTPIYATGGAKLSRSLGNLDGAGYSVVVNTPRGDLQLLHLTPGSSPLSRG